MTGNKFYSFLYLIFYNIHPKTRMNINLHRQIRDGQIVTGTGAHVRDKAQIRIGAHLTIHFTAMLIGSNQKTLITTNGIPPCWWHLIGRWRRAYGKLAVWLIYIDIHTHIQKFIYTYIYKYIQKERERETEIFRWGIRILNESIIYVFSFYFFFGWKKNNKKLKYIIKMKRNHKIW